MENYKILLEDEVEIFIEENILIKIPYVENIIKKNLVDTFKEKSIDLNMVSSQTFNFIITLIRFNKINSEGKCDIFNINFIKNMNLNALIDFLIATHFLNLEKYHKLATIRFMSVFKKEVSEIRDDFQLKDDIIDVICTNSFWKEEQNN